MEFDNGAGFSGLRRGRVAKGGLAALLALFLLALMAGPAEAGTPAYSLSVKYSEGGSTPLYHSVGLATDSAGNVYVLTAPAGKPATVQKFSASGKYLTKFGSSSGVGSLSEPVGVDVDSSGNVWVACRGSSKLVEFGPTGSVLKEISTSGLGRPSGVAADGLGTFGS
jgi:DNA-binding beta-propeller fold protein YncE